MLALISPRSENQNRFMQLILDVCVEIVLQLTTWCKTGLLKMIKTLKETVCKSNSSQLSCYPAVVISQTRAHTCFTILAVHLWIQCLRFTISCQNHAFITVLMWKLRVHSSMNLVGTCNSSILPTGGASAAITTHDRCAHTDEITLSSPLTTARTVRLLSC